jgi:hypothetical protein
LWEGPLPVDIVKRPESLVEFVRAVGDVRGVPVGTVCIDSTKDVASKLSSDEVGGAINRALGALVADGVEVVSNHHQRKATGENKKPTSLADVYGSTWITAGTGSVVLLWGEPGDPVVEMTHLKQPAEAVGPFELEHDHERGVTTRADRPDVWTVLQAATTGGISASNAARAVLGGDPDKNATQKVRRKLDRFVKEEKALKIGATERFAEALYRPMVRNGSVTTRDEVRDGARSRLHSPRNPGNNRHAPVTQADSALPLRSRWAGRDGDDGDGDDAFTAAVDVERAERIAAEEVGG